MIVGRPIKADIRGQVMEKAYSIVFYSTEVGLHCRINKAMFDPVAASVRGCCCLKEMDDRIGRLTGEDQ